MYVLHQATILNTGETLTIPFYLCQSQLLCSRVYCRMETEWDNPTSLHTTLYIHNQTSSPITIGSYTAAVMYTDKVYSDEMQAGKASLDIVNVLVSSTLPYTYQFTFSNVLLFYPWRSVMVPRYGRNNIHHQKLILY
jgi:hypothetical protein